MEKFSPAQRLTVRRLIKRILNDLAVEAGRVTELPASESRPDPLVTIRQVAPALEEAYLDPTPYRVTRLIEAIALFPGPD